jgi:hypothetical protein
MFLTGRKMVFKPLPHWQAIYEEVKQELKQMGLNLT